MLAHPRLRVPDALKLIHFGGALRPPSRVRPRCGGPGSCARAIQVADAPALERPSRLTDEVVGALRSAAIAGLLREVRDRAASSTPLRDSLEAR